MSRYNPSINSVRQDAFPNQYVAFDKVLCSILKHMDDNTYLIIFSDHGHQAPPRVRRKRSSTPTWTMRKTTPVHRQNTDFADGDDVPGSFFAMGPGIKHDLRLMGLGASVYDVAPTILHLYGIEQPKQMRGRVLTELFEEDRQ